MMQAERDKRPVESVGLERQLVRFAGALFIVGNRIFMPMADVEHRLGLVDADYFSTADVLGERPRDPARARGQIENDLAAFERQHFDQFFRKRGADTGQGAPVKLGGVRRIVKAGLVLVTMITPASMAVFVRMLVLIIVGMAAAMLVRMLVLVFVRVFMRRMVVPATRLLRVPVPVMIVIVVPLAMIVSMFVLVIV